MKELNMIKTQKKLMDVFTHRRLMEIEFPKNLFLEVELRAFNPRSGTAYVLIEVNVSNFSEIAYWCFTNKFVYTINNTRKTMLSRSNSTLHTGHIFSTPVPIVLGDYLMIFEIDYKNPAPIGLFPMFVSADAVNNLQAFDFAEYVGYSAEKIKQTTSLPLFPEEMLDSPYPTLVKTKSIYEAAPLAKFLHKCHMAAIFKYGSASYYGVLLPTIFTRTGHVMKITIKEEIDQENKHAPTTVSDFKRKTYTVSSVRNTAGVAFIPNALKKYAKMAIGQVYFPNVPYDVLESYLMPKVNKVGEPNICE